MASVIRGDDNFDSANVGTDATTASPVTLSGNSVTLTGIPLGVDEFEFYLISASSNAYYLPRFRLGTSGGIVSSGYTSSPANSGYTSGYSGYGNISDGFYYPLNFTAVHQMVWRGFRKPSSNTWVVNGYGSANSSGVSLYGGGEVTLSGALSQIFLGFQYTSTVTWTGGTVTLRYK